MLLLTSAAAALLASTSAIVPAVAEVPEPDPKAMSQADIRLFNSRLDKGHKYYIRCKRSAAIGSYIKREFSCRTTEQWAAAEAKANQEARDIGEEMKSKAWTTSG